MEETKNLSTISQNLATYQPYAIKLGCRASYLLRLVRDTGLKEGDVSDLVEIKEKYETDLATLSKIIRKGYTVSEASEILDSRTESGMLLGKKDGKELYDFPSIEKLMQFQRVFFGLEEFDSEQVQNGISCLKDVMMKQLELKFGTSNYIINKALNLSEKTGITNLEGIVDALEEDGDVGFTGELSYRANLNRLEEDPDGDDN